MSEPTILWYGPQGPTELEVLHDSKGYYIQVKHNQPFQYECRVKVTAKVMAELAEAIQEVEEDCKRMKEQKEQGNGRSHALHSDDLNTSLWYDVMYDRECWAAYIKKTYGFLVDKNLNSYIEDQYHTPRSMENLIRIAMDIDITDEFWEMFRTPDRLKTALYKTINSIKDNL